MQTALTGCNQSPKAINEFTQCELPTIFCHFTALYTHISIYEIDGTLVPV